jgi:membrane protease YdiL (CAAX protease family)
MPLINDKRNNQKINIILQVFLAFIICVFITLAVKTKPQTFNIFDGLIFLLIYYITSIQRFKFLVTFKKSPFELDLVPFLFLFVLILFIVQRQVEIGFTLKLPIRLWLETIVYSIIWTVLGITICVKMRFLTFRGWKVNILQALTAFLIILYIAFSEEIYFRGLVFNYLNQTFPGQIGWAFVISLLFFGFAHFTNGGWPMVLMSTLAGIFISWTYIRTGSIYCATLIHTVTNVIWIVFFKTDEKLLPVEKPSHVIKIAI